MFNPIDMESQETLIRRAKKLLRFFLSPFLPLPPEGLSLLETILLMPQLPSYQSHELPFYRGILPPFLGTKKLHGIALMVEGLQKIK